MILLKILLIDDHKMLAQGLGMSLSKFDKIDKVDIMDSEFTIDDIIKKVKLESYDLILMDINISKICQKDGISLSKCILEIFPNTNILGLTGYDYPYFERECHKIGMKGFANKEIDTPELYDIIIKIASGQVYFSKDRLIDDTNLTTREIEIAKLYASGMTRVEVAKKLYISPRTLAVHLNNIFKKLDVSNFQEMLSKLNDLGYLAIK